MVVQYNRTKEFKGRSRCRLEFSAFDAESVYIMTPIQMKFHKKQNLPDLLLLPSKFWTLSIFQNESSWKSFHMKMRLSGHANQGPDETHFPSCHAWGRISRRKVKTNSQKSLSRIWPQQQQERTFSNYYHVLNHSSIIRFWCAHPVSTQTANFCSVVQQCKISCGSSTPCWTTLIGPMLFLLVALIESNSVCKSTGFALIKLK